MYSPINSVKKHPHSACCIRRAPKNSRARRAPLPSLLGVLWLALQPLAARALASYVQMMPAGRAWGNIGHRRRWAAAPSTVIGLLDVGAGVEVGGTSGQSK